MKRPGDVLAYGDSATAQRWNREAPFLSNCVGCDLDGATVMAPSGRKLW